MTADIGWDAVGYERCRGDHRVRGGVECRISLLVSLDGTAALPALPVMIGLGGSDVGLQMLGEKTRIGLHVRMTLAASFSRRVFWRA